MKKALTNTVQTTLDMPCYRLLKMTVARIVLESVQDMLLKLALQMAHDDYEDRRERQRQGIELAKAAGRYAGRKTDTAMHQRIEAMRAGGKSIAETARLAGCSQSQVKRVCLLIKAGSGMT